ncbi:Ankyrin repeat domain-containing protein 40 [Rhizoclosmatium sp. JEL0117]|nr:Ankyrin repeat domain-containing protein 40 [Rhizoclosmatium sp. JEL0117]
MEFLETCAGGNKEAVARFLTDNSTRGDKVRFAHPINGFTGLMWAAKRNHVQVAALLLDAGADPNTLNSAGKSAKDLASTDEMRALLGAERNQPDQSVPQRKTFVPNYLIDPATLPPIDMIMAGAASSDLESAPSKPDIPQHEAPKLQSKQPIYTRTPQSEPEDLSSYQEIIVYLSSRYDSHDRTIVGAIHITPSSTISALLQQAFDELDILVAPDSKLPSTISRLDFVNRVIPVSKKQFGHKAALHFKHGHGLIIHQN